MIRAALAVALMLVAALPAPAQEAAPAPAEETGTDEESEVITVLGRRPEGLSLGDVALDFVAEVGDPAGGGRGYARWTRRICVGVVNVPEEAGQYLADRISRVALELGLEPGEPGCRPNIAVFFTDDGPSLARRLVETEPRWFRPFGGEGGTTQGLAALDAFAASAAPVRWWQITAAVDREGDPAVDAPSAYDRPPVARGANSRIEGSIREALWTSLVIVDSSRLGETSGPQLADYLAMVALAQIDPEGRPGGHESILNLFAAGSPPPGMTAWDRSYLRALYAMDAGLMPRSQRGALVGRMVREHRRSEED